MGFDRYLSLYSDFEYRVSILIPARDFRLGDTPRVPGDS